MKAPDLEKVFCTLTTEDICHSITHSQTRVIYAAPGIFRSHAEALAMFGQRSPSCIRVILNPDPEICRLGYGELGAVEYLMEAGIIPHKAEGLRVGILIVDKDAWFFTPTPYVIEEPPAEGTTNAVAVSLSEAQRLVRAIVPETESPSEISQLPAEGNEQPKLGIESMTKSDVENVREDLKECPPQRFDLARRVRVYQAYVQFVELSLNGCHIQRHTISIPKDIFNLAEDINIQERLKTSFRLIDEDSSVSSKGIEERVARLRKTYLRSLGKRYGTVILRRKKDKFLQDIEDVRREIEEFGKNIQGQLTTEFIKCKSTLIATLIPAVIARPPDKLIGGIKGEKPSEDEVGRYLEMELEEVFPDPGTFIRDMKLECLFKDVTYEVLNDPEFQTLLEEQYPLIKWPKPYEEFQAARQI